MVNNSNKIVQTKSNQPSHVSRFSLSGSFLGCVRCCLSGALQINDLPHAPSRIELRHDQFVSGGVELGHQLHRRLDTLGSHLNPRSVRSLTQLATGRKAGRRDRQRERARSVYALYAPVKLIMNAADSRQVCSRSCLHLMIRF